MRNVSQIATLRFGLGGRPDQVPPADPRSWLDEQTRAAPAMPPGPTAVDNLRAHAADLAERSMNNGRLSSRGRAASITRAETLAWAERRLTSPQPFRDRLVDFWMNHLSVTRRSIALTGALEREAIRPHVTGKFADMLVAAVRHPAMLLYLTNAASIGPNSVVGQRTGQGLNENLAREILELHTMSPASGYTQADVTELAKVLTGWSVAMREEPFGFQFRVNAHEPGEKVVLGRRFPEGEAGGEAVLRFLAGHPATHRHLATKLVRHFVADEPPPGAVRRIEGVLRDTGGDLGEASRALVQLPEAWDPPLSKLRSPQDFVVAACRALAVPDGRADAILTGMAALSQRLWGAPQPNGWADTAAEWATPEALMRRVDWAHTLAGRFPRRDARAVAEAVLGPLARAETVAAMSSAGSPQDAITILLASPEFMRR